tara:strand:- start:4741 stop:5733 length:993 start_codon:yes stop_codon:yes gene_type:complete
MARNEKKSINKDGMHPETKARINKLDPKSSFRYNNGLGGKYLLEPVPTYLQTQSEEVLSNRNGSFIVLGRDRPKNRFSGYGGIGDTQAASIDLVVGRMGAYPKEVNDDGEKLMVEPDFKIDSARIYISQKTDVDKNFKLASGRIGSPIARSAIALKADGIRIMGREGIKLITTTDRLNSQGGRIKSVSGIDLIAGNDSSDLQPLVKGDNVVEALDKIMGYLTDIAEVMQGVVTSQLALNVALQNHVHVVPPSAVTGGSASGGPIAGTTSGGTTLPNAEVVAAATSTITKFGGVSIPGIAFLYANVVSFAFNYLRNPSSDTYILSRHNNTN